MLSEDDRELLLNFMVFFYSWLPFCIRYQLGFCIYINPATANAYFSVEGGVWRSIPFLQYYLVRVMRNAAANRGMPHLLSFRNGARHSSPRHHQFGVNINPDSADADFSVIREPWRLIPSLPNFGDRFVYNSGTNGRRPRLPSFESVDRLFFPRNHQFDIINMNPVDADIFLSMLNQPWHRIPFLQHIRERFTGNSATNGRMLHLPSFESGARLFYPQHLIYPPIHPFSPEADLFLDHYFLTAFERPTVREEHHHSRALPYIVTSELGTFREPEQRGHSHQFPSTSEITGQRDTSPRKADKAVATDDKKRQKNKDKKKKTHQKPDEDQHEGVQEEQHKNYTACAPLITEISRPGMDGKNNDENQDQDQDDEKPNADPNVDNDN